MAIAWNDLLTIGLAILTILNFAFGRGDKSNKDTADKNYRQGILDQQLKDIFTKLEKIERKLDTYDTEIDNKVEKAIKIHINQYHQRSLSKWVLVKI